MKKKIIENKVFKNPSGIFSNFPLGKNNIKAIIFDVDGVLIDVSGSYRIAIKRTAEFFLGKILDMSDVEAVKNRGINDDIDAAELIIQEGGGEDFRKKVIIKKFQEFYLGRQFDGFVRTEKCLMKEATLKKLKKYKLGIVTGRPKLEANFGLKRFKIYDYFNTIIVKEDVKEGKPSPLGLLKAIKKLDVKNEEVLYVGDNLADLRAADNAGVSFVGVVGNAINKTRAKNLLKSEGCEIILNKVNDILNVI
jgi:HAD superfamily phosphatase